MEVGSLSVKCRDNIGSEVRPGLGDVVGHHSRISEYRRDSHVSDPSVCREVHNTGRYKVPSTVSKRFVDTCRVKGRKGSSKDQSDNKQGW